MPPAEAASATLPPVTVTATRTDSRAIDTPASVDVIDGDTLRANRAQVNLSEGLGGVPGLLARDRQNYAQDVQLSVRGFGSRATFGIRGVRLYVDGIPATLPDGQGQITHVDLGSAERVEVLRGPFSSLYGNSSGGVVLVETEEGRGAPRVGVSAAAGSDGLFRFGVQASGETDGVGYRLGASRFHTDGSRAHSAADRRIGNAKLTVKPSEDGKLTIVVNSLALPLAQDPLGLTRTRLASDPQGVDPVALQYDTRKRVNQTQGGITYVHKVDASNELRLMGYVGQRGTEQFQAIPAPPTSGIQNNPLHPGGVISLKRDYEGADLRWTHRTRLGNGPLTLIGGLAHDRLDEQRRGYQNFIGSTLGVQGALRRDERNEVTATDGYVQARWMPTERWTLEAGARHSRVRFQSQDQYVVGTNPDDSGGARYSATLPVFGAMYSVTEDLRLYASAGRGFETPTLNELSYRPGGETGLNFGLQSARSDNVEAGVKAKLGALGEGTFAVFQTTTDQEIVTQTNTGGRATFQNAGSTRRRGLELGWSARFLTSLSAQAAFTWLEASYRDSFLTCAGTPCPAPNLLIPAGTRMPGVARTSAFASLAWLPTTGWRGGVEWRGLGDVAVNDTNSDKAAGYGLVSLHGGYQWQAGSWELGTFVRVDNLLDKAYVGSVIVNEGNARFFEPAPGRTWLGGVSATLQF